jgi:hypothetical protein
MPTRDAQNPASRLGKILRIDPATGATENYAIGVRNPWRYSFDRANGDLWIGDVGQATREEIDVLRGGTAAGSNLGWVCWEGNAHTVDGNAEACSATDFAAIQNYVPPVVSLEHTDGWVSITGGVVVRDPQVPSLAGRYLWGDIGKPHIYSTSAESPGDVREETALAVDKPDTFGQDACGRVYVGVDPGYAHADGQVFRLEESQPSVCRAGQVTTPPDTRPCALSARAGRSQHVLRKRRFSVVVTADEPCSLAVSGRGLSARTAKVNGATATPVRLRAGSRLLRSLRRHRSVKVRVRIAATDGAGNRSTLIRMLRARR